jgi:hypothetical protein
MRTTNRLRTGDIPQADRLVTVRQILNEMAHGNKTVADISGVTGVSPRHVQYRSQTARILRLIKLDGSVTPAGTALLETIQGSLEETRGWRRVISSCPTVRIVAPDLFDKEEIARTTLADRIQAVTDLSRATAERRAMVFSSWRRQLLAPAKEN